MKKFNSLLKGKVILLIVGLILVSVFAVGCGQKTDEVQQPAKEQTKEQAKEQAKEQTKAPEPSLKAIAWGASSVGSNFYAISIGMGDIVSKKAGINVSVEPVGGSDANVRALVNKKIEVGMLNAASARSAFQGTDAFEKDGKIPVRIIAQGQESLRSLVVRNASNIKSFTDLKGKTVVAKRKSLKDIEQIFKAMLKAHGMTENDVKIIETAETNQAIEALKLGTADAALIPGGIGASFFIDLSNSTPVTFLSIPDDKLDAALGELGPAWHKTAIPKGTYKGQDQDVIFPATSTVLAVMDNLPEDTVYSITKALMESPSDLAAVHAEGKNWTTKNTLSNPAVPFHPGAIKYFKEASLWTPELDKLQGELSK